MIETLRSLALAAGHSDLPIPENRNGYSLADLDRAMDSAYFGMPTYSGQSVSQRSALQVGTVWACINRRSLDWARMPFETFEHVSNGHEYARNHYLWSLLQQEANPEMTAFIWKRLMQTWVDLAGNAYAEMEMNGRGQITALWPWRSDKTTIWRDQKTKRLMYTYTLDGGTPVTVEHDRMFHLRGMTLDGIVGLSPIEFHKQTIGSSMAMTEHGARLWANGARPLGIIKLATKLSDEGIKRLRETWDGAHQGSSRAHRIAILEEGYDYQEAGMKMVDAQYLETMRYGAEEICRIFEMPPHKVALLDKMTNNNIEFLGKDYIDSTIGPIATNWEQQVEFAMLSLRDRQRFFVKSDFTELLRGDMKAQAEYYSSMANNGALTPNEMRRKIGQNPLAGELNNVTWRQGGMVPVRDEWPVVPIATQVQQTQSPTKKPNGVGALTQ